jgi:2,4'-dihydroxyacetophenone dioxygenase
MNSAIETATHAYLPAHCTDSDALPWIPMDAGKWFKPLRLFGPERGRVLLLRLEPGTGFGRHRHTGEVHGFTLQGKRKLCTGETIGAGGYVYEPPGNIDSWGAVGDETLIVLAIAYGAVEYLDRHDRVTERYTVSGTLETYRRHCEQHGLPVLDLLS